MIRGSSDEPCTIRDLSITYLPTYLITQLEYGTRSSQSKLEVLLEYYIHDNNVGGNIVKEK